MSPRGFPTLSITMSQASMHAVQLTHSSCVPLRMSMPVGQTSTHWSQSTQSPAVRSSFSPELPARLAAHVVIGDDDGVPVEQHSLQPAVRTDEDAGLFAEPGEDPVEEDGEAQRRRSSPPGVL